MNSLIDLSEIDLSEMPPPPPLFAGRIAGWSTLSSERLWLAWRLHYTNDVLAASAALWAANRLVKLKFRSTRRAFYEVKDSWIRNHQSLLVAGSVARVERRECWNCGGTGDDGYDLTGGYCYRCDGTGIFSERTLYLHEFDVYGTRYRFHSYMAPEELNDAEGEDALRFGTPFSPAEEAALLLPMSGLLRMLRWRCAVGWPEVEVAHEP